jgi:hypothetical protein
MEEKKKENTVKEAKSIDDIAKNMVENMRLNIQDPQFLEEKERLQDQVRHEVLERRKKRNRRKQVKKGK